MGIAQFLTRLSLGIFQFVTVDEGTRKIVTRFGRYGKTLRPGLRCYLSAWGVLGKIHSFTITDPYTLKKVTTDVLDYKEIVFDYPEEKVISKDNVQFEIDAILYFQIVDAKKCLFNVDDYVSALHNTVQSILRAEIGNHSLEECYTNRIHISASLAKEAGKIAEAWGIHVLRLEIQEFDIGKFSEQLLRQKEQEIEKRQEVLHAEGLMEAKIREAEGIKESEIRIAQGRKTAAESEAEAIRIRAKAEAEASKLRSDAEAYNFRLIKEALGGGTELLEKYLVYHTAENISKYLSEGNASKVFLPAHADSLLNAFVIGGELRPLLTQSESKDQN
jgi:regulator of protease activity HflC (stomatin/prohibitin superfamily)